MKSWNSSRALLARARESLAGGVSSPFRAQFPVPLYFTGGRGSRLTDADGNEYIDYVLAWGPMILGYARPALVEAVRQQAEGPHAYGQQHELEILVAEKIQQLVPCAQRVAFTSSGSEAVQLAMRLCRAYTGRNLILKFEGHYHGWVDSALIGYHPSEAELGPLDSPGTVLGSRGQVPNAAGNVVVAPWNRLEILERILEAHPSRIAAVMMEPVLCNSGCLLPLPGYLEGVRDLCTQHGALLVFDEVITGFRMALGTFGKAVAGGLPLSVVAGRADILEQMFECGVAFGGTFNGNPLSMAAANAALTELSRDNGAALAQANRMGERLMQGICALARMHNVPALVTGFGAAFAVHFTSRKELLDYRASLADDREKLRRFLFRALEQGLHIVPDGRFYVSAAHTESDIDETLLALDAVFSVDAGQQGSPTSLRR